MASNGCETWRSLQTTKWKCATLRERDRHALSSCQPEHTTYMHGICVYKRTYRRTLVSILMYVQNIRTYKLNIRTVCVDMNVCEHYCMWMKCTM